MKKPYLQWQAYKQKEYLGHPNHLKLYWGIIPVSLRYEWRWDITLSFKFKNQLYILRTSVQQDAENG